MSPDISFNILEYIVKKISPFIVYREIRFSPTILPQGINLKFLNRHSLLHHILFHHAKSQVSIFCSLCDLLRHYRRTYVRTYLHTLKWSFSKFAVLNYVQIILKLRVIYFQAKMSLARFGTSVWYFRLCKAL